MKNGGITSRPDTINTDETPRVPVVSSNPTVNVYSKRIVSNYNTSK